MRARLFNLFFWTATIFSAVAMTLLLNLPGRRQMARAFQAWGRSIVRGMRAIAGIRIEVRGRENIPAAGPSLMASKHQSECDGMVMAALVPDIAFVAMREVWEYPLVGRILRRLEMIRVDTCGGDKERRNLATYAGRAHQSARNICIYPEGHLINVGEKERYRTGIFYLYRDLNLPVIPVAHALGLRWPTRGKARLPGRTAIHFLPAIPVGLDRATFMRRLEETIEHKSAALAAEMTGKPYAPSRLVINYPDQYPDAARANGQLPSP